MAARECHNSQPMTVSNTVCLPGSGRSAVLVCIEPENEGWKEERRIFPHLGYPHDDSRSDQERDKTGSWLMNITSPKGGEERTLKIET